MGLRLWAASLRAHPSAPTRLDTDLLPRDGGSVTPGWLLGTQHTAPKPLGSSLGCRLLTASRGQGPPGAAVSAPLSRPPQVGCWGPPAGGHPGLPLRLRPPPPPALRDGVSLSTTALRTIPGDIVCVSQGMRVMREHSTPKASPLRGARPQLPSPTCAWLGPAGDQQAPGPHSWTPTSFPLSWCWGHPEGALPEAKDP